MKPIHPYLIALAALACQPASVLASPTDNEYEPCHRMAAMVLQYCLDRKPGYVNDDCWSSARKQKDVCYADVRKSHRPDDKEMAEKKRRAMEIEARRRAMEIKQEKEGQ